MDVLQIGDLPLTQGGMLKQAVVAFESRGRLNAAKDNVVLVLHGYTSGPDTILPVGDPLEGSWRKLVGPSGYIDTDRFYVICPNAIGSTYGSTGAGSIDPDTEKPYGSRLPAIGIRDVVASQKCALDLLGIGSLVAVAGPSFGAVQALQWGVDHPRMMRGVVAALVSLGPPPVITERVRAGLSRDRNWNGGDYYGSGNPVETLVEMRIAMLKQFGVDEALAGQWPDGMEREKMMAIRARRWAANFDANALINLQEIMGTYDIRTSLDRIRAKVLYVLSRTDPIFPPSLAEPAMSAFSEARVDAQFFEIDSALGHSAASADGDKWGPVLKRFLEAL